LPDKQQTVHASQLSNFNDLKVKENHTHLVLVAMEAIIG
jgi:hypothetical protein